MDTRVVSQKAYCGVCCARVHWLLAGLLLHRHAACGGRRRRCGRLLLLELRDELHLLQHVRRHLWLPIAAGLALQPRQDRSACLPFCRPLLEVTQCGQVNHLQDELGDHVHTSRVIEAHAVAAMIAHHRRGAPA